MALPAPARGLRGSARVKSNDPLREGYLELFRRSYRRAEDRRKGGGMAVYRSSAGMIDLLCGERWAWLTIFPTESSLAGRFVTSTGLPIERATFVRRALMANLWASTWTGTLLELEREPFEACCRVAGADLLEAARAAGRGVILAHSHTAFTQLFWRWLEHRDIDAGLTLWQWTWSRNRSELNNPKLRAIEGARELYSAMKLLAQGKLVQVLADGGWGDEKLTMDFYNRRRPFQSSFAELALSAGAAVLTVDAHLSGDGIIHIDIADPLPAEPPGTDDKERALALVNEYAEHLRRRWAAHASSLEWYQMTRHLKYPPSDGGGG